MAELSDRAAEVLFIMTTKLLYLLSSTNQTWVLQPRQTDYDWKLGAHALVTSDVVEELLDAGYISGTSNRTFVVTKSGIQVSYCRKMKTG